MNWRCIGPANMGGRITAIAVVESDPTTYYVATASGGLLKTTNNGTTFEHLFDKESTVSIGDVAVAPVEPEHRLGRHRREQPAELASPTATASTRAPTAARPGRTWGSRSRSRSARSSFTRRTRTSSTSGHSAGCTARTRNAASSRPTDGGKTWKKVLFVDDKTGVIDLRMDPFDPNTLLVGMWERKRDEFDGFYGPASDWPDARPVRARGHARPRRRAVQEHRRRQDLEEAHRREGRDRPAHA